MLFQRLAAALGLAALATPADEDAAIAALGALQARTSAPPTPALATVISERDTARAELAQVRTALDVATKAGNKVIVDGMLSDAYRAGKLRHGRDENGNELPSRLEARLRRIAGEPNGIEALTAELDELEVIVPVRTTPQSKRVTDLPARRLAAADDDESVEDNPYLASVAQAMGLKLEDCRSFAQNHIAEGE